MFKPNNIPATVTATNISKTHIEINPNSIYTKLSTDHDIDAKLLKIVENIYFLIHLYILIYSKVVIQTFQLHFQSVFSDWPIS